MKAPAAVSELDDPRSKVLFGLLVRCAIASTLVVPGQARAVDPLSDLRVEKSVDEATPFVGESVVFAVQVTNDGPAAATGVEITDLLPSGLDFVSANPSQGLYSDATGIWDFQTTQLAAAAMATLEITATVNPGAGDPAGTLHFLDEFVGAGSGGLSFPEGLEFGPDGNLYVTSGFTDEVLRYDGSTGAFVDVFVSIAGDGGEFPVGVEFGPDGNLYVVIEQENEVRRYDGTNGAFIDVFVSAGSGGLLFPQRMQFGPDGNLYVGSTFTDQVLRYNGTTGAFVDAFVSAASGGLDNPRGLVFGPDGNLYVTSSNVNNAVLRYDGTTGAFIDTFVGTGLNFPQGLVFGADGNLYVSSSNNDEVRRYDGTNGAFIEAIDAGGLDFPRSLLFGPDGHLYVAGAFNDAVLRYDGFITNFAEVTATDQADPDLLDNRAGRGIVYTRADYGDAPDPLVATAGEYPTLLANDGARHVVPADPDDATLVLGYEVDAENDGQPTATADGDDSDGNDDEEDGVIFASPLVAGESATVAVRVSGAGGLLNAWIDFDQDGVWGAAEQVFTDEPVAVGLNLPSVSVPASATPGATFARFRLDTTGGLAPTGLALDGEVEDHLTPAIEPQPDPPPLFAKAFAPDVVGESFDTTLTFTIDNSAGAVAATDLAFLDTLPFDLLVAAEPVPSSSCGGVLVAAPSTPNISLSGGSVAASATCTISVGVNAPSPGAFENVTNDLTSSYGNSGTASDTLTVTACTAPDGANLTLANGMVQTPEQYEVCNTIEVEEAYQVLGPDGALTLRAGVAVVLSGEIELGTGSEVVIETDPSLIP